MITLKKENFTSNTGILYRYVIYCNNGALDCRTTTKKIALSHIAKTKKLHKQLQKINKIQNGK